MATFKVTVDSGSELGKYLSEFDQRGRSREVYFLASMGLVNLRGQAEGAIVNGNTQADVLTRKAESKAVKQSDSKKILKGCVEGEKIEQLNQLFTVDFGDDIMDLA